MQQVIIIWWGDVYETYDLYLDSLRKRSVYPFYNIQKNLSRRNLVHNFLPQENYQIMVPDMPAKWNADYIAWKIRFERHLAYVTDSNLILVGRSLGTTFLLKYLTENTTPTNVQQLHLVSSYVTECFPGEVLGSFEFDLSATSKLSQSIPHIALYHSTDDTIVPISDSELLHSHIPSADMYTFTDRWHFIQPEFPELVANIIRYS